MPLHSEIQNYLKALLEHYDFVAEKERYISPTERIDLYGHSNSHNKTIGIEITLTSDARKDAERLARYGFDLAYIITDNPKYETKMTYHGRDVPIVHYNRFESELRRALNISPSFPRFGSFEEWATKPKLIEPTFAESRLEKFIQVLKSSGLDEFVEDVVNLIGMLYITKEVSSMYRDPITYDVTRYGGKTKRPQYEVVIDPKIINILKSFGLIFEEARGSGKLRKYFISLTDKGKEIGKEIIVNRINTHSRELDCIIKEFGKMSAIIATGTLERYAKEYVLRLDLSNRNDLFDHLAMYATGRVIDHTVDRTIVTHGYKVELKYGRKQEIHPLLSLISHFIAYYNYDKTMEFFSRLEEMGLAYEVPVYDSRAQFTGNEVRGPVEVFEYIFSREPLIESNEVFDFGALTVLLALSRVKDPKVAREEFEEFTKYYEIPPDKIREILDRLNSLGITSKYIELPESSPFLIFDGEKFEEFVREELINKALDYRDK